jgi:hypothetical protein
VTEHSIGGGLPAAAGVAVRQVLPLGWLLLVAMPSHFIGTPLVLSTPARGSSLGGGGGGWAGGWQGGQEGRPSPHQH